MHTHTRMHATANAGTTRRPVPLQHSLYYGGELYTICTKDNQFTPDGVRAATQAWKRKNEVCACVLGQQKDARLQPCQSGSRCHAGGCLLFNLNSRHGRQGCAARKRDAQMRAPICPTQA